MCDEMNVIYEDGVENGLEVVVERLAEERDRITGELQKTRQEVIEYKQEVDDLERRIMMVKKTHLDKFPSTLQGQFLKNIFWPCLFHRNFFLI